MLTEKRKFILVNHFSTEVGIIYNLNLLFIFEQHFNFSIDIFQDLKEIVTQIISSVTTFISRVTRMICIVTTVTL